MTDQVLLGGAGFVLEAIPVATEQVNLGEQLDVLRGRQKEPHGLRQADFFRPKMCRPE